MALQAILVLLVKPENQVLKEMRVPQELMVQLDLQALTQRSQDRQVTLALLVQPEPRALLVLQEPQALLVPEWLTVIMGM
jgi:hypothetical protein